MRWFTITYNGDVVGGVDHAVEGRPSPGIGWHTICATRWADGERTNACEWGLRPAKGERPRCKRCGRRAKP